MYYSRYGGQGVCIIVPGCTDGKGRRHWGSLQIGPSTSRRQSPPASPLQWSGLLLPFGLRSAPRIISAVANAIESCCKHKGTSFVEYYLDDYIIEGMPGSKQCAGDLQLIGEVCSDLQILLPEHKRKGHSMKLTFLVHSIDSVAGSLSLPPEKHKRLIPTIQV